MGGERTNRLPRVATWWLGLLVGAAVVAAGCAADIDVEVERSIRSNGDLVPDAAPVFVDDGTGATPTPSADESASGDSGANDSGGRIDGPLTTLDWASCDRFDIPTVDVTGSAGWECATLSVPMNPFGSSEELETVDLAVTRHRATGNRQGALLANPGGPGGSGLRLAWGWRGNLPASVLRGFDIVSWDPRGVSNSVPQITCGDEPDVNSGSFIADCARETGDLSAFLAAPYTAADMEALRIALGESELNYIGYSYGSSLGAEYAAMFPDTVGRFVLDGVVDPDTGSADGYFENGFPYFADDGFESAALRFAELCDLTDRCDLGNDTSAALDEISDDVDRYPTDDFANDPEFVDQQLFGELLASAMSFAGDWEVLGTALADARRGDASALAALASFDPSISSDALDEPLTNFELANRVIYCADFAALIAGSSYCDPLPVNERTLSAVSEVEIEQPMLLVGTEYDPSTPGKHAPEFAEAIGDAVHIIWEGVGHTAFPSPSSCINDAVTDYLVDGTTPIDGLRCAHLDTVSGDAELADELFGHGDIESERLLRSSLEFRGGADADRADCMARELIRLDDQVISHVALNVTSGQALAALDAARNFC